MGHYTTCIVCNGDDLIRLTEIRDIPVHCNVLKATKDEALRVQRADMDLSFCRRCGHVFNSAFDPTLMGYTGHYENALHFSKHFQEYADSVAERLVSRHNMVSKEVLEIGCGSGEFLQLICDKGNNTAVGFDPSQACHVPPGRTDQIKIVPDFYSEAHQDVKTDLVICRHVLEHIETPRAFLHTLLSAAKSNATIFYIEVPNGKYTIGSDLVWDIIYEHCSYFTKPSLSRLFSMCGYEVSDLSDAYGGQFLYVEASPGNGTDLSEHGQQVSMNNLISLAKRFGQVYESTLAHWNLEITRWKNDKRRVVLWGGGSKGVMFLNAVNACASFIEHVVDINPRKHGKYVAGTGQSIVGPSDLNDIKPDVILIMNPVYRDEIANQLTEIGIASNISVVSAPE